MPYYGSVIAQTTADKPENQTLIDKYDDIMKKSTSYQDYKVVKKTYVQELKQNIIDSIASLKKQIADLETLNEKQKSEGNSLKSDLQATHKKLETAINEKDSFSFLGIYISKGTYNSIVWILIFALILGILVVFTLYKRTHVTTAKTKETLREKQEEFDAHRKWALEREQTLSRELNKLKQKYKGLE